jgi:hypothetical protein
MRVISILVTITVSVAVAGLLYEVRSRHRFWYGVGEVVAGLGVIVVLFNPPSTALVTEDFSFVGSFIARNLSALGGLYLMVRGLDNIDQNLPARFRKGWGRIFSKNDRS